MERKVEECIVNSLKYNARTSYEKIARDVNNKIGTEISANNVEDKINQLFQTKKIFGFSSIIDPRAFNLFPVVIWVSGEESYNVVRQQLNERTPDWGNITEVVSLFGEYDFLVKMYTDSIIQANSDINNIISSVDFFSPTTTIQTEIYREQGFNLKSPFDPTFNHNIDDFDKKIVELLQQNCRITNEELGESIGLVSGEVTKRIEKMEAESIILGYYLDINHIEYNKAAAIVNIILNKKSSYEHVINEITKISNENIGNIYSALGGTGTITIRCFENSVKELSILIDQINGIPGVRRTKTHLIAEYIHKCINIPIEG